MFSKSPNHSKIIQCSFKIVGKIAPQVWKKSHLHITKLPISLHLLSCCGLNKNRVHRQQEMDKPGR